MRCENQNPWRISAEYFCVFKFFTQRVKNDGIIAQSYKCVNRGNKCVETFAFRQAGGLYRAQRE